MSNIRPPLHKGKAIGYTLLSAFFVAFMANFAKLLVRDVSTEMVILARFSVGFLILMPTVIYRSKGALVKYLKTSRLKLHLLHGILSMTGLSCFYHALKKLPLEDTTLLVFTFPLFVPIVARLWKKVAIIPRLWWGILLGLLGIVIILNPTKTVFQPYALVALMGGITGATSLICKRLLVYTESREQILFYLTVVAIAILGTVVLMKFRANFRPYSCNEWLYFLGVGTCGYFYQYFLSTASKYAPARFTSVFLYSSVAYAALLDWFIWNHKPSFQFAVGFSLVVLGAVVLFFLYPRDDLRIVKK